MMRWVMRGMYFMEDVQKVGVIGLSSKVFSQNSVDERFQNEGVVDSNASNLRMLRNPACVTNLQFPWDCFQVAI
jgi:hypothetical protein